jgi:hypothetical protein
MPDNFAFRSTEEEVNRLLDQIDQLRQAVGTVSRQLSRIESHVKRAFPGAKKSIGIKSASKGDKESEALLWNESTGHQEDIIRYFDRLVGLARENGLKAAESSLEKMNKTDLLALAKELGVSFVASKPTRKAAIKGLVSRINERIMISKHINVSIVKDDRN